MVNSRLITTLALVTSFFALGVIALGAFTRLIDAGLGCPDWPGCYGHFIVPSLEKGQKLSSYPISHFVAYKAWAEMIHRYFVGALSIFILSIIFLIFKIKRARTRSNIILAFFLLALLIYQIILGSWTVTLKLLPIIVTQHLLGGFLILSVVWLIYLNNKSTRHCEEGKAVLTKQSKEFTINLPRLPRPNVSRPRNDALAKLLPWAIIGLILLLFQITLGAWTSTNYASLSCPGFPWCDNNELSQSVLLSFHFNEAFHFLSPTGINYEGGILSEPVRQTIQMTHRLGALIFTLYMILFTVFAMPVLKQAFSVLKVLYGIVGLICIQLCLGITNVIFKLPLIIAICHNLVAAILLLFIITFVFKLSYQTRT